MAIATPLARAEIHLQGAHITKWVPTGQKPVLFLSSNSAFAPGKPIRGGVPLIFPWFGPRTDSRPGPAHGFARTSLWDVESTGLLDNGDASLWFTLRPDASRLRFKVTVGATLSMELQVSNTSEDPLIYEEAFHTYFAVGDVRQISIGGLEGTEYLDKTDNAQRKVQPSAPVRIEQETDRVYLNTEAACTIEDPAWNRRIVIEKCGSRSTVVWNPWVEKSKTFADLAPGEWPGFVCIESANVAENRITLAPGQSHTMAVRISLG